MSALVLKASSDRKVQSVKGQKNSLGLLPGLNGSCPHATQGEGGCLFVKEGNKLPLCYVEKNMARYKNVRLLLTHNTDVLKGTDEKGQQELLEAEFARFYRQETARANRAGTEPYLWYRLHWSGDFFDVGYARAMARAVAAFPEIQFWVYTRSLFALEPLSGVANLGVYISLDAVNTREGLEEYYRCKQMSNANNLAIAYLSPGQENDYAERWAAARSSCRNPEQWPKSPETLVICPTDNGSMQLERACMTCGKCRKRPGQMMNVWFRP